MTLPKTSEPYRLLVVDDDPDTLAWVEEVLATVDGYAPVAVGHPEAALEALHRRRFHALLSDLELPGISGLELIRRAGDIDPELLSIVLTGHADVDHAVGALRAGAFDFLTKPLSAKLLRASVQRAVQVAGLRREVQRLRDVVDRGRRIGRLVGSSPPVHRLYEQIERLAGTQVPVLVRGESGTGKELVARELHERSTFAEGPFVAVNCAAVPANLLESELFGHAKGAFTGAQKAREGLFRAAQGGTLFLDEVGELPLEMQPKLLRALQEGAVRPVGGEREVPFETRLVYATNRDLSAEVEAGAFREDLYYRIHVVALDVPPLRDRGGDVLVLAHHFLSRFADRYGRDIVGFAPGTEERLLAHAWPGNVRELENAVERAVALARHDHLTVEDLPASIRGARPTPKSTEAALDPEQLPTLAELEIRHVERVLRATDGNKAKAARILGIDRRTLYRKLDRLDAPTGGGLAEVRA